MKLEFFTGDLEITALKLSEPRAQSQVWRCLIYWVLMTSLRPRKTEHCTSCSGRDSHHGNHHQHFQQRASDVAFFSQYACSYSALEVYLEDEETSNKGSASVLP